ncbi:MAG: twin-arginine translocation signal domain-containing protein [Patescibacteria group bacterium]|nr:twin-arginine translocation signal domain-containing protein [Patescibacteria group bacterium]
MSIEQSSSGWEIKRVDRRQLLKGLALTAGSLIVGGLVGTDGYQTQSRISRQVETEFPKQSLSSMMAFAQKAELGLSLQGEHSLQNTLDTLAGFLLLITLPEGINRLGRSLEIEKARESWPDR